MVIRLGKFEAAIALTLIIAVSFISAVRYENRSVDVLSARQQITLPVIMYHHITENKNKTGKYTVLNDEFKADLEYIKEKGYEAVTVNELISFVKQGKPLPDKPIMITFDDGFESFYSLAFPILKEYGMKAVVSVIGSVTEKYSQINDHNINYSNLTFDEIKELDGSGLVEIQNHSYDMHKNDQGQRKGMSKNKKESESDYALALKNDLEKMQKTLWDNCQIKSTAVVYPYGAYSKETLGIVKSSGYECTMLCEERINTLTQGDTECLYGLGRFNRESGIATEDFFERILSD